LKVKQFPSTVPPGGLAINYYTDWTFQGKRYWSEAQIDASGAQSFSDGTIATGRSTIGSDRNGSITRTDDGGAIIEVEVPLTDVGSPAIGASLGAPTGLSSVLVGVP